MAMPDRTRPAFRARTFAAIALAAGVASALGILWAVISGDQAPWYLLMLVPSSLFSWWIAGGFLRRAGALDRQAE